MGMDKLFRRAERSLTLSISRCSTRLPRNISKITRNCRSCRNHCSGCTLDWSNFYTILSTSKRVSRLFINFIKPESISPWIWWLQALIWWHKLNWCWWCHSRKSVGLLRNCIDCSNCVRDWRHLQTFWYQTEEFGGELLNQTLEQGSSVIFCVKGNFCK
jgi:hypothetical protein